MACTPFFNFRKFKPLSVQLEGGDRVGWLVPGCQPGRRAGVGDSLQEQRTLALVEIPGSAGVPLRGRAADLGRDEGIAITIAAHPTREGEEVPPPFHRRVLRCQFGIERGVEIRRRVEDRALEIEDRVFHFLERPHAALADLLGVPERFERFVRIIKALSDAPDLGEDRATFGLGGMSGKDRLNFQLVEAVLKILGVHTGFLKFLEEVPERHSRHSFRLQVPHAGAFLAKIRQLEEQAERVGNLVGLSHAEVVDERALGLQADAIAMMAGCRGEPADLIQAMKDQVPSLLADDRIQVPGQVLDLLVDGIAR